jgi:hypothetical protein
MIEEPIRLWANGAILFRLDMRISIPVSVSLRFAKGLSKPTKTTVTN